MCNYILPSYQRLCRMIEDLIVYRLDVVDDEVDGIDGADGEAYLRHVYLSLKEQGMVSVNDLVFFWLLWMSPAMFVWLCVFLFVGFCNVSWRLFKHVVY